jgi:RNA-binding protein
LGFDHAKQQRCATRQFVLLLRFEEKNKMPPSLNSTQRKKLRSLAHHLNPVILIGQNGLSADVIKSIDKALNDHELIKIKFNEHKESKKELTAEITQKTKSSLAGLIGNIAIVYRQNKDLEKRKIRL